MLYFGLIHTFGLDPKSSMKREKFSRATHVQRCREWTRFRHIRARGHGTRERMGSSILQMRVDSKGTYDATRVNKHATSKN
jgi:hypothetical protein